MGAIIEFPADAASRRPGSSTGAAQREGMGTILILPVVRIERDAAARRSGAHPYPSRHPERARRCWGPRAGRRDAAGSPPQPPGTFLTPDIFYAGDVDTDPDKASASFRNSGCAAVARGCNARR